MRTLSSSSFFFNDTATTEIYTLSLHDALPIWTLYAVCPGWNVDMRALKITGATVAAVLVIVVLLLLVVGIPSGFLRSEEHTSELQSHLNLVCRLLLEKKKKHYDASGLCLHLGV